MTESNDMETRQEIIQVLLAIGFIALLLFTWTAVK